MKLAVIIPCYNEEKTIEKVIEGIPKKIRGIKKIEIIVVDDGSCDGSLKVAKRHKQVVIVAHRKNEGYAMAFKSGLDRALRDKSDIVVNIDADMQFNPKDIPILVEPILRGKCDMVTASRLMDKSLVPVNMSKAKIVGNKIFTAIVNMITGEKFYDTQCGFRAYSRELVLKMNLFGKFNYSQELFIDVISKGAKVAEIPVKVTYFKDRKAKLSGSLTRYTWNALLLTIRSFRDYKPLLFFGVPGVIIFSLGVLSAMVTLIYWLVTTYTTPVRMYFFSGVFLMTFGLLLIILALIADMFKRIKQNVEQVLYITKKEYYSRTNRVS